LGTVVNGEEMRIAIVEGVAARWEGRAIEDKRIAATAVAPSTSLCHIPELESPCVSGLIEISILAG